MSTPLAFPAYEESIASVKALNGIALAYTADLAELNLGLLRKYTDATLSAWREALAVNDVKEVPGYLSRFGEVSRELAADYVADVKAAASLGQNAAEEARKVVEANFSKVATKAS